MTSSEAPVSLLPRRLERLIQKEYLVNHDSGRPLYESLHRPAGSRGQLRAFVDGHEGWKLVEEYRDEESGATGSRARFQALFEDAHQRKFEVVVFWALDRFSREGTRATINYLHELESYGVGFVSYTERYLDSTGIFRDALIGLLAALANQEGIRLSDRERGGIDPDR